MIDLVTDLILSIQLKKILRIVLLFICILFTCKEKTEDTSKVNLNRSDSIQVKISWENKNLQSKMRIFEPPTGKPYELWQTGNVTELKNAPISIEIDDGKFYISPGSKKTFVLVMQNTTAKPIYFFAAPHSVHPEEHSLGFKFKCLCVNHAFTIAPQEYWYRVVELRIAPSFLGDSMDIKHILIGITEEHSKQFGMDKE